MVQTNKLLNEHEVNNLFSRVAPRYDLLNNVISLGTQKIWRHEIFNQLQIKPTDNALDVCCGTGDLAIALAKRISAGRVTGLDFNKEMLEIAKEKTKMIGNLFLVQGDAMRCHLMTIALISSPSALAYETFQMQIRRSARFTGSSSQVGNSLAWKCRSRLIPLLESAGKLTLRPFH